MSRLGPIAAAQLAKLIREHNARLRNTRGHRGRWQPRGGEGNVILKHGIIRAVCSSDCNTYEVEIIRRSFSEECGADTATGTG